MSESFSDLWASSNPVKSQSSKPRTLGVAPNTTPNVALRATPDTFSMLASASSSRPNSRPITPSSNPSNKHMPVNSRSNTSAGDAFGGLVSFGHSTSRDDGLTIAERAARAEQERRERIDKHEATSISQGSFWEKYEGSSSVKNLMPDTQVKANDLWDLDFLSQEHASTPPEPLKAPNPTQSTNNGDVWDLNFIDPKPAITVTPSTTSTTNLLDVDHLDSIETTQVSHSKEPSRRSSPANLDFDGRADQLLGAIESQDEDEDDILGSLAKPVGVAQEVPSKPPPAPWPSHTSSASPPPHIIGRIVEMGFSVQQAKDSLLATPTGLDVEAALEILLHHDVSVSPEDRREEGAVQDVNMDRSSRQRQESSRPMGPPAPSSSFSIPSESPLTSQQGLQDQADKLLSQASTIGMTMFTKANTFWKESREKVIKAYEEQRSTSTGAEGVNNKGRPRWMENSRVAADGAELSAREYQDLPRDSRVPGRPSHSTPVLQRSEHSVSLFENESVYRSPARRRPAASASTSKAPSPPSGSTSIPLPPVVRPSIEVSPSVLATSGANKSSGTKHFKLGRFAEAEAAYSRAIDELPASHLLRIPLHNNRALTRLKTGEYKGTVYDTSEVLRIITGDLGAAWHPGREEASEAASLGDAVGKALRRRAEAFEGLEKWKEAVSDWERLSAAPWVSAALKGDAAKAAGRCRRMVHDGRIPTTFQKVSHLELKPQSQSTPSRISPARSSEALTRVRAAAVAQEKEEQARHDLKDVVDARLATWRTGKENNLRALIASLDVVLSPTFGWQTVGMSELISPGQLKVQYTKAIAKLHPDKLNVNNTTLEERMIANSVFGTLSEAWNASR